jgi:hypothetical protein
MLQILLSMRTVCVCSVLFCFAIFDLFFSSSHSWLKPRNGRILLCWLFCSKMGEFGLVRFRREILCVGDSAIFVVSSVHSSPPLSESYCGRPGSS